MKLPQPTKPNIDIEHLRRVSQSALQVMQQVRSSMLAPSARKSAPTFNTAGMAELCGVDKPKILYETKKGRLPAGVKDGARLEWNLMDAQTWVRDFRKDKLRNPALAAGVVIAIANFKGGVTKTTTAVTLAQGLSLRGHKILVVDTDPQGSLTTLFGVLPESEVEEDQTVLPLCAGETTSILSAVQKTYWEGIDLVAASSSLFSAEFLLPSRQSGNQEFEFWRVLDHGLEEARGVYDIIIIDTPPSLGYLTINALMAAEGVVMPLPPSALDFASSTQFWSLFTDLCDSLFKARGSTKKYHFVDVLLTRVDRSDVVSAAVRQWIIAAYGAMVVPVEIPKTSTAATASAEFGTVYDLSAASAQGKTLKRAKDAYNDLVDYIEMQVAGVWASDALNMKP